MSDSFSAELWHGVAGVYDAILAHPFLTGLTDGSLPHGRTRPDTPPFPYHEPLRVDVLGHGLPQGSLARLTSCHACRRASAR